jgi:hypothetical protein
MLISTQFFYVFIFFSAIRMCLFLFQLVHSSRTSASPIILVVVVEDEDERVATVPRKKVPVSTKKNLSKKEIFDCLDTLNLLN